MFLKLRDYAFNVLSLCYHLLFLTSSADSQNGTKSQACAVTPTDDNAALLPDKALMYLHLQF